MDCLLRCLLALVLCSVCLSHDPHSSPPEEILDFMSVILGTWSNKAQIDAGSQEHDYVEGRVMQVKPPALGSDIWLISESAINGSVVILNLMKIKLDENDKNTLYTTHYYFTDPTKYKFGDFNVEELENVTQENLRHEPGCVDSYLRVSKGVYSGICKICNTKIDGKHPSFAVTLSCDECTGALLVAVPPARASDKPYVFKRTGPRYPLLDAPKDYVSPCDKPKTDNA